MRTAQQIEQEWEALASERMTRLAEAVEMYPQEMRFSILQKFNTDPYYERRFDLLEAELEEVAPNHPLLHPIE